MKKLFIYLIAILLLGIFNPFAVDDSYAAFCPGCTEVIPDGDDICNARTMAMSTCLTGEVTGCGGFTGGCVDPGLRTMFYDFVAPGSGSVDISLTAGTLTDIDLMIIDPNCASPAFASSTPNNACGIAGTTTTITSLTPGLTYIFQISDGTSCVASGFTFNIGIDVGGSGNPCGGGEADCTDGIDNDSDGDTDCADSDCSADPACVTCAGTGGNTCGAATVAPLDSTCCPSTLNGASDNWVGSVGCQSGGNPEVWFTAVPTLDQLDFTIDNLGAGFTGNIELVIVSDASPPCGSLTIEGSQCGSAPLNFTLQVTPGTTYYWTVSSGNGDNGATSTFDICVKERTFVDNTACNINDALTPNPAPTVNADYPLGTYGSAQTVEFCYNINNWDIVIPACNWLIGIVPSWGDGWDPASFTVTLAPVNASGDGGSWGWWTIPIIHNITGADVNPDGGWFYCNPNPNGLCSGINSTLDWGDGCIANDWGHFGCDAGCDDVAYAALTWDVCFTLTTWPVADCQSNNRDLSVGIKSYADGEIGSWTDIGCMADLTTSSGNTIACCDVNPTANFTFFGNTCLASASTTGLNFTNTGTTGGTATFNWTFPSGTPGTSTAENPTGVTWAAAGSYTVKLVVDTSGCGATLSDSIEQVITILADPSTSAITGTTPVCENDVGVVYSVTPTGGSTYAWTVPGGASITAGAGTASITVTWGATSGDVTVTETNAAGCIGSIVTFAVTVNLLPTTSA
ncbi:PKD domain-containing protein, partial [bacterium AH-315-M05]|nr:PKD domain-containing protein [bacterium AH-315-M05]